MTINVVLYYDERPLFLSNNITPSKGRPLSELAVDPSSYILLKDSHHNVKINNLCSLGPECQVTKATKITNDNAAL